MERCQIFVENIINTILGLSRVSGQKEHPAEKAL
jgi:hypothetical protein